jgi:hypothetical protein
VRGAWRRGLLLLGILKDMYSKALGKDVFLHRFLSGKYGRDALYLDFERKVRFCFIKGYFLLGNMREIYRKALERGNCLHKGPVTDPGMVFVYRGPLETLNLGFYFLDPEDVKSV